MNSKLDPLAAAATDDRHEPRRRRRPLARLVLTLALGMLGAWVAQAQSAWPQAPSEPMRAGVVDKQFSQRSTQFASGLQSAVAVHRALPSVTAAEKRRIDAQAPRPGLKAERVGFARELGEFDMTVDLGRLAWQPLADGSRAVKLSFTSPGAVGLRVAIDRDAGKPAYPVLIRAAGSAEPTLIEGPMNARDFAQPRFYSAYTAGESITLEFQLPAALARLTPADLGLRVVQLTHFDRDFLRSAATNKAAQGTCYRDIACETPGGAEEVVSRSVARYIFSNSQGTYTCTGTLMNDADASTQIQHFLSANHCVDTAAEAASVTTFWWDQNTSCSGTVRSSNYVQLSGGADIQAKQQPLDMILMRLRGTAPASAILAGWTAAPMTFTTPTVVIHHPGGDRKKISRANANAFSGYFQGTTDTHVRVLYTQSSTEGGSSGSGLFTLGSNGYQLRGTLSGGDALCTNPSGFDYFGRLDKATDIVAILNRQGTTPTISPETGWYWDDTAGGQGFGIEILNGRLFIGGFLYDAQGNPIWFVANGAMAANGVDFVADMQEWQGGQSLTGSYKPPTQIASPGTVNLSWTSNTQLVMRWPGGLRTLKRYPIPGGPGAAAGPAAGMPQRGWWWNAGEAGRGFMLEVQGSQMFMTGFMYLVNGYRTWYLSTGAMTGTSVYQGTWQQYGFGQTYTSAWVSPTLINVNGGALRIDFTSTTTAVLTLPNSVKVNLVRFTNF